MSNIKIVWNNPGFEALRQDPGIQADITRRAKAIAAQANAALGEEGYEVREPTQSPNRDRAAVITATNQARSDNSKNMTLVKSLGAGA